MVVTHKSYLLLPLSYLIIFILTKRYYIWIYKYLINIGNRRIHLWYLNLLYTDNGFHVIFGLE